MDISFLTKSVLDELEVILHPKTPQEVADEVESEAASYIKGSGVDLTKLDQPQIDLWTRFYIQFRLYNVAGYEAESKEYLSKLDNQLIATYKAQQINYDREKENQSSVSSEEEEVFSKEFWKKYDKN